MHSGMFPVLNYGLGIPYFPFDSTHAVQPVVPFSSNSFQLFDAVEMEGSCKADQGCDDVNREYKCDSKI